MDLFKWVDVETTTVCNRKCYFCPNSMFDRGVHFMNEILFKKIIDELKELNCVEVFTPTFYGEPLLDPRLPKLLRYVKNSLNCQIEIYTNEDFLDDDMRARLSSIEPIYIINKPEGYKPPNPLTSRGGLIKEANHPIREECDRPATILTVNWKGDVLLCCEDYLGKYVYGNLNKEKIIDIWNKSEFKKVREDLLNGEAELPICQICFGLDIEWRDRLKKFKEDNKITRKNRIRVDFDEN